MPGAIQRQRSYMDRLAGLVDGLFRGEENGGSVAELNALRVFRRSDIGLDGVTQRVAPHQAGREAELRLRRTALVQVPGIQKLSLFFRNQQLNSRPPTTGQDFVVRVGDDQADGRNPSAGVRLLAQNVDNRAAENHGNRVDIRKRGRFVAVVSELVA